MATLKNRINTIVYDILNRLQYPLLELLYCNKRMYTYCFCNKYFKITKRNNYGDDLNCYYLEKVFGKVLIKPEYSLFQHAKTYSFIGSILEYVCERNEPVIVWGTGFKFEKNNLSAREISKNTYLAVRGPLTREIILKSGGSCPAIYGDPGILISRFIKVERAIKYKYGVIPHKLDAASSVVIDLEKRNDVKVISISQYHSFESFIADLNSCEYILSSSLHGLIISDSYRIPNLWMKFSNKLDGGDFKFFDYYKGAKKQVNFYECQNGIIDFDLVDQKLNCWEEAYIDPCFIKSCPVNLDLV